MAATDQTPPTSPAPGTKVLALKEFEKVVKTLWDSHQAHARRIAAVVDAGKIHEKRVDQVDRDHKGLSDDIGIRGRHCQDTIADLDGKMRTHIGGTVSDINSAMLTVDAALMKVTQDKFTEFHGDAKEFMR